MPQINIVSTSNQIQYSVRRPAPVPPHPHLRPLPTKSPSLSFILSSSGSEILSCAKYPSTFSKYLVLSKIDHSLSFDQPKRALFCTKYDGMTDINRKWTNLVRKMLCVWPRHASKHHISENKYLFMSRERSTLVATPTYVPIHTLLFRVPLPMMKSTMGYTSNNNCAKPSYFPSNSVCQCNQNSKMC